MLHHRLDSTYFESVVLDRDDKKFQKENIFKYFQMDVEDVDVGENVWPLQYEQNDIVNIEYSQSSQSPSTDVSRSLNRTSSSNCRLLCGICSQKICDYDSLCSHVIDSHGLQARMQTIQLQSWDEFDLWKQQVNIKIMNDDIYIRMYRFHMPANSNGVRDIANGASIQC